MRKEIVNKIGEKMVIKMREFNRLLDALTGIPRMYDGRRIEEYPVVCEYNGMREILKIMNVRYTIEYTEKCDRFVAILIEGKRFEV